MDLTLTLPCAARTRCLQALKVLNNFATFWYAPKNAALINGLCAERCRELYSLGMMRFMPGTDCHGNALCTIDMGKMEDFGAVKPSKMIELSVYTFGWLLEQESVQRHGVAYVESMAGFSMRAAMSANKHLDKAEQKEMMSFATDTLPMRIRHIYLIHQPWYFTMFWTLVKPFLKAKLRNRLQVLGKDLAALHKLVPAENLPTGPFGGTLEEPPSAFLDALAAREAAAAAAGEPVAMLGGFAVPFSVEDPTGAKRRAAAAAGRSAAVADASAVKLELTASEPATSAAAAAASSVPAAYGGAGGGAGAETDPFAAPALSAGSSGVAWIDEA